MKRLISVTAFCVAVSIGAQGQELEVESVMDTSQKMISAQQRIIPEAAALANARGSSAMASMLLIKPFGWKSKYVHASGAVRDTLFVSQWSFVGYLSTQRNSSNGEGLGGLAYQFRSQKLQVGVMLGFETGYAGIRSAPWLAYETNDKRLLLNAYFENQLAGYADWSLRGDLLYAVRMPKESDLSVRVGVKWQDKNGGLEISLQYDDKVYFQIAPVYQFLADDRTEEGSIGRYHGTGVLLSLGGEF